MDVIQEFGNEFRAYEIKSASQIHPDFFKNMRYLKKLYGNEMLSSQVIYDGERDWNTDEEGYMNYSHWKENNPWEK